MNVYKDFFKAFKLHRFVVEFTTKELQRAIFTPEEKIILKNDSTDPEAKLEKAQIFVRGIKRRQEKDL